MEYLIAITAIFAVQLAAVISPGPNFAIVSRLAVTRSRFSGLGAACGIAIGATVYAVLTMVGLSALLARIGWLSSVVQIAGGCYLIFIGVSAWRSGGASSAPNPDDTDYRSGDLRHGFKTGLLVCLSNPKTITFFVSIYAIAVPAGTPFWVKATLIAGGFAIEVLWYSLVTVALSSPRPRAAYHRFGKWIERVFGTLLIGFGARLIWQNRP